MVAFLYNFLIGATVLLSLLNHATALPSPLKPVSLLGRHYDIRHSTDKDAGSSVLLPVDSSLTTRTERFQRRLTRLGRIAGRASFDYGESVGEAARARANMVSRVGPPPAGVSPVTPDTGAASAQSPPAQNTSVTFVPASKSTATTSDSNSHVAKKSASRKARKGGRQTTAGKKHLD